MQRCAVSAVASLCACARARVRACVRVCVRACVCLAWGVGGAARSPLNTVRRAGPGPQANCTQEAGTYFLYRPEGAAELQLLCLDDAGDLPAPPPPSPSPARPAELPAARPESASAARPVSARPPGRPAILSHVTHENGRTEERQAGGVTAQKVWTEALPAQSAGPGRVPLSPNPSS